MKEERGKRKEENMKNKMGYFPHSLFTSHYLTAGSQSIFNWVGFLRQSKTATTLTKSGLLR
jgi:hypothetical protein